jgi:hypothetical protein
MHVTLEQYLENYFAFRKVGLCQENEDAINNQTRGPLFRQFTTIIKIHTEIRCENINRTEKTQKGSCVINLLPYSHECSN